MSKPADDRAPAVYEPPMLHDLGSLKDLTLGGNKGTGESKSKSSGGGG